MRLDNGKLLVFPLAEMRIDDNRAVVTRVDEPTDLNPSRVMARDDGVELPGRRRRAREEEVPRDVDLERGLGVLGENILVPGKVHQLVIVPEDVAGAVLRMATFDFVM